MEIVVFHSDIARLVLGYLKNQKLEKASRIFCRTSPHLQQEYTAFKQGLQAHSFFPELEEIIREYVQIARQVEQIMTTLSEVLRSNIHQKRLSEKLNVLLDLLPSVAKQVNNDGDVCNKTECCKHTGSGNNVQLDKENRVKKQRSGRKRKRTSESFQNSSNERLGKINSLTGTPKKRQRVVEPFCYLSVTRPKLLHTNLCSSTSSNDPQLTTENNDQSHDDTTDSLGQEEEEEVDSENDSTTDDEVELKENVLPKARAVKNEDMSMLEKPRNESTPRTKPGAAKIVTPSLLEFSQAILDNPGFQETLVHNINQALQTSETTTTNALTNESKDETKEATRKTRSASVNLQEAGGEEAANIDHLVPVITPSQLLDQMVKEILANTEKDPTFDAIIEEVVEGFSNKSQVSTGVQCNIDSNTKNVQQLGYSALGPSHDMFSTNSSVTPSTPVVIRTAAASATSINGDPQALPSITANSSFGSLIDPNFSISKLIVLNASESAQKQPPETASLGGAGNEGGV